MSDKPNKWIALVLGIFAQPFGLLYAGAPRLALLALLVPVLVLVLPALYPHAITRFPAYVALVYVSACGVLAFWIAGRRPLTAQRCWYNRWYGTLGIAAIFSLVMAGTRTFVAEPFRVNGSSMEPTLHHRSIVLVKKWGYGHLRTFGITVGRIDGTARIEPADIVAFKAPVADKVFLQRVVGVPGDLVVVRPAGVEVNGVRIRQREIGAYVPPLSPDSYVRYAGRLGGKDFEVLQSVQGAYSRLSQDFPPAPGCTANLDEVRCKVAAGTYFVMGDNRDNSVDSRVFGTVAESDIVGKVVGVVTPGD